MSRALIAVTVLLVIVPNQLLAQGKGIRLWNLTSGQVVRTFSAHDTLVEGLSFSFRAQRPQTNEGPRRSEALRCGGDDYSAATSKGTPGPKVVDSVPFWM